MPQIVEYISCILDVHEIVLMKLDLEPSRHLVGLVLQFWKKYREYIIDLMVALVFFTCAHSVIFHARHWHLASFLYLLCFLWESNLILL